MISREELEGGLNFLDSFPLFNVQAYNPGTMHALSVSCTVQIRYIDYLLITTLFSRPVQNYTQILGEFVNAHQGCQT